MTTIRDIKNRKLRLIENGKENSHERKQQTYETQQILIDDLYTKLLGDAPKSQVHLTVFKQIVEKIFYNRPSLTVITFLESLKKFDQEVLIEAIHDFNVYICSLRRRQRVDAKAFYTYLKTAERFLRQDKTRGKTALQELRRKEKTTLE